MRHSFRLPGRSCEQLPFLEPADDLLDRLVRVVILDDLAGLLLGRRVDLQNRRAGARLADAVRLDPHVGGGLGVQRLLLRAHDRLERRVAWLVDGIADRDDRGQLDLEVSYPYSAWRSQRSLPSST